MVLLTMVKTVTVGLWGVLKTNAAQNFVFLRQVQNAGLFQEDGNMTLLAP